MNEKHLIAIASLLSDSERSWSWYKIDRALSRQPAYEWFNVVEAADVLASEGLIQMVPGDDPGMPTYRLTDKGKQWLDDRQ
ncbi:hypothetical protein [Ralstonia wenshanensis]|uniref:hypothetical protein n=1 Tax=Ralstonia wenshanensis TaxID=2842456 RepID=UPI0039C62E9D